MHGWFETLMTPDGRYVTRIVASVGVQTKREAVETTPEASFEAAAKMFREVVRQAFVLGDQEAAEGPGM